MRLKAALVIEYPRPQPPSPIGAGVSRSPALEVMLMTMPPPWRFMTGRQSLIRCRGAMTLHSIICSIRSTGVSSNQSMCPGPM